MTPSPLLFGCVLCLLKPKPQTTVCPGVSEAQGPVEVTGIQHYGKYFIKIIKMMAFSLLSPPTDLDKCLLYSVSV